MKLKDSGVAAALTAALLFGASTPLAKLLLERADPWLLAALLYLGSGTGLWLLRQLRRSPSVRLAQGDWRWMAGATLAGGVVAPILLMTGLAATSASNASLLLNAEGVFTALLAWFVFKENFDKRIALGMLAITAGAVVLTWPTNAAFKLGSVWPALAVLGACLAWAIDNNLTRKVALADASWIAMVKGLVAGSSNLIIAVIAGATWPGLTPVLAAAVLGFLSYGASLTLFVIALRQLGSARTGAYFCVAPFFGTLLALILLHEPVTWVLLVGGTLMAVGVALHMTEHHAHEHTHEPLLHDHEHTHSVDDLHHDHEHDGSIQPGTRHAHQHQHVATTHLHPHFPDAHHHHHSKSLQ